MRSLRIMRRLCLLALLLLLPLHPLVGGTHARLILFDQKRYQTEVEPALKVYLTVGDSEALRVQIKRAAQLVRSGKVRPRWDNPDLETFEAALALLEGKPGYDAHLVFDDGEHPYDRAEAIRNLVSQSLAQALLNTLCLVREKHQILEFNLWDSEIRDPLYRRSPWIKAQFWGMTPNVDYPLAFSTASGSGPLPVWFVHEFDRALEPIRTLPGTREAQQELLLLKRLIRRARTNPQFRLVLEY